MAEMQAASPRRTDRSSAHNVDEEIVEIARKRASGQGAEMPRLKKPKPEVAPDFLDYIEDRLEAQQAAAPADASDSITRQFWKAGDVETQTDNQTAAGVGMDHVRVHPKFLHSNATSHKWALGAFAELLDNALDEANNGATYVHVDVISNPRDGSPMLLIEDDGGGMTMQRMRQCMSFGYSEKSKAANTIGQYGNGFKTSTMRLGADVIVFSKSIGKAGERSTRSIGLLSYTFLMKTSQQDIIVPMLDYEVLDKGGLTPVIRGRQEDWDRNRKTIVDWSPYQNPEQQLNKIKKHGTRIIIYNLWYNDQGQLELDFEADDHDIHVRGVRDENKVKMADNFKSARRYFLYEHSLRAYASILYLRLPNNFTIKLRKKEVKHHSVIDDLIHVYETTYTPKGDKESKKGQSITAVVTIGFVKDAAEHIDVQGFNVYHKNRLIKPFWRLLNVASSIGRGVVGVLEANFVEPAHDKQGFERTSVLQRLEHKLQNMQKTYWNQNCNKIGYQSPAAGRKRKEAPVDDELTWRSSSARKKQDRTPKSAKKNKETLPSSSSEEENEVTEAEDEQPAKETARKSTRVAQQAKKPTYEAGPSNYEARLERTTPVQQRQKRREWKTTSTRTRKAPTVDRTDNSTPEFSLGKQGSYVISVTTVEDEPEAVQVPLRMNEELGQQLHEIGETRDALNARVEKASVPELEMAHARNKELEAQIDRMETELRQVQHVLLKERDGYKEALEEERKQREIDDKEIRRQLKDALQRVRKLMAEKKVLEEENEKLKSQLAH